MLLTEPQDVTVDANEWAQFSCIVHCGHLVAWYMAGHPVVLKRNNTVPGLLIRRAVSRCTQSNERGHFFEVLATGKFNKSTFYCVVYERHYSQENSCSCGTDRRYFSRPALLTGENLHWHGYLNCGRRSLYAWCLQTLIYIFILLTTINFLWHCIVSFPIFHLHFANGRGKNMFLPLSIWWQKKFFLYIWVEWHPLVQVGCILYVETVFFRWSCIMITVTNILTDKSAPAVMFLLVCFTQIQNLLKWFPWQPQPLLPQQ